MAKTQSFSVYSTW